MARQTKSPKILIGRSGNGRPLDPLINALREQGYHVTEQESSAVGAHSNGRSATDLLNQVDMAFLVVRERDGLETGGAVRPFQQLLREAGVMQGKMGMNRVVLLVENTVDGLSADSGVSYIRFPPDRPGLVLNDVLNKIGAAFPSEERDLHERVPIPTQARSAALRIPWLLVGVVLLAAAIPLIVALSNLIGGDDDSGGDQAGVVVMSDVGDALSGATPVVPTQPADQSDDSAGAAAGPAVSAGAVPSGPGVIFGSGDPVLPAQCSLDLSKGSLLNGAIVCQGAGQLEVVNGEGPWHNDLAAVILGDGVVGELRYEAGGSRVADDLLVELGTGLIPLDLGAAAYGVESLTLWFSGDEQHVHLVPRESAVGEEATLTFTLDR
ncbi:MAG: TIR domain-containing protein [Actinomycetota bacterium]